MGGSLNLEDSADADHEEGYRFLNLELDGPGMGDGIFVYNDLKDVLICNVEITGYATAINLEGSNKPAAGSDGKNARVMVRGSRLHDNTAFGFLGACDGCGVEYSYFDHNGQNNEFDHNIYFSGIADGNGVDYVAKGMRAVGNELYHAAQGPGTVCEGTALVVHGQHDGLLIQGNRIIHELGQSAAGCWGIGVVPGYGGRAEGFTNVTIVGNTVVNVGNESIYAVGLLLGSQPVLEPDEPSGPWASGAGNLAAWQAKSGLDLHSIAADPKFTRAADSNFDFTAAAGSPLLGAGDPTHGAKIDIAGNTRPAAPDIGAYQH